MGRAAGAAVSLSGCGQSGATVCGAVAIGFTLLVRKTLAVCPRHVLHLKADDLWELSPSLARSWCRSPDRTHRQRSKPGRRRQLFADDVGFAGFPRLTRFARAFEPVPPVLHED
jgi:hypothetical protein